MKLIVTLFTTLLLMIPVLVVYADQSDDLTTTMDTNPDQSFAGGFLSDRLILDLSFETHGILFNNRDFTPTDEESDDTIFDTDDATMVVLEGVQLNFGLLIPEFYNMKFHMNLAQSGFWGKDQLSSSSEGMGGALLNFLNLYIEGDLVEQPNFLFNIKIGRQFFQIGGMSHDYMLKDVLDAVVLQFDVIQKFSIRVLAFDLFGMGVDVSPYDYLRIHTHRENEDIGMRGDVNTLRMGAIFESDQKLVSFLDMKAYFFFAKFGALPGGGSDRSINGQIANFGDDDYSTMGGIRGIAKFQQENTYDIKAFLDAAFSYGVDQRAYGAPIVDNLGFAINLGGEASIRLSKRISLDAWLNGWYASGGHYRGDGYMTRNGFVSFKGSQMGGFIVNKLNGFHPSAYTDDDGIDNTPQRYNRKSGTFFINLGAGFSPFHQLTINAAGWLYWDTNATDILDFSNIASNDWMSAEEIEAQERFGKMLGFEWDVEVLFHLTKPDMEQEWDMFIRAGMFFPGSYYEIEITELAGGTDPHADTGTAFGGTAPTMSLELGTMVKF
jgi:hypothetical protein